MRKKNLRIVAALAITAALLIPAFIFTGAALAAPLTWVRVNTAGFGYATPGEMGSALCMTEYNGFLYAGTINYENANGCAVWRYDGGTTWTQVATGGFGDGNNEGVFSMAEYGGLLYAGTYNEIAGCEVWSYDGTTWTQEVGQGAAATTTGPGFGSGTNIQSAGALLVFNDLLYVGAGFQRGGAALTQIWSYDGTDWAQVNTDDFGVASNNGCRALAVYGGKLYAGTNNSSLGCAVWRYDGPTTADWVKVSADGFGGSGIQEARVMEVWNGQLYVGTAGTDTPQVWTYDGTNWTDVTPTYPDAKNDSIRSMTVYKGALYVGVGNNSGIVPMDNVGAQVYRYSGGAPEQVNLSGFDGDKKNQACHSLCEYQGDLYAGVINYVRGPDVYYGAQVWKTNVPSTWYLAEGSTDGGMETFVLVQNPNPTAVTVDVNFMTGAGAKPGPQDSTVPANSRVTFKVNDFVTDFNVSTMVTPTGGDVICERSMYGGDRTWAHDSIGVTDPSDIWFLAEGSTDGGMETFVLVQNPNDADTKVSLDFMTSVGAKPGPQDYVIAKNSRTTFKVNDYVTDFNVSIMVTGDLPVICERSMYGGSRTWATDSIGVTLPDEIWYLAEGATAGDFETFVLVQNPNNVDAIVDVDFMTSEGAKPGPQDYVVAKNSRVTFKVNDYVTDFNVSTMVTGDLPVIVERSVYGGNRTWAHDSIGTSSPEYKWYLAEGCTAGDFETFVLIQNPNATPVTVSLDFMTSTGPKAGPQDVEIAGNSRDTFYVGDFVVDFNVSTMVTSAGGPVICERAMYGNARTWAHDSIGFAP